LRPWITPHVTDGISYSGGAEEEADLAEESHARRGPSRAAAAGPRLRSARARGSMADGGGSPGGALAAARRWLGWCLVDTEGWVSEAGPFLAVAK